MKHTDQVFPVSISIFACWTDISGQFSLFVSSKNIKKQRLAGGIQEHWPETGSYLSKTYSFALDHRYLNSDDLYVFVGCWLVALV